MNDERKWTKIWNAAAVISAAVALRYFFLAQDFGLPTFHFLPSPFQSHSAYIFFVAVSSGSVFMMLAGRSARKMFHKKLRAKDEEDKIADRTIS
tara:strand:- start:157 stop:438 length:282 start_codon:yes stop_codon:yes gene_type:complete